MSWLRNAVGSVGALALATGLVIVAADAVPAGATGWAQFGARAATWHQAHTPDLRGCSTGPCFGPRVHSDAQPYAFTHVTTARGRIDGYDQAMPNGTSQASAALRAMALLPPDATMGSVVVHHDRFGQSCAYVNFSSKTLKAWFGVNLLAGSGNVGVELATITGQGHTTYNPADVNVALVAPTYLGSGDNC